VKATGSAQRQGLGRAVHFVGLLLAYALPYSRSRWLS
jgi:hypothetical protein